MSRRPAMAPVGAMLDAVPVPNKAVRAEPRENALLLWAPIRKRWWNRPPFSWALPYRDEKAVALDRLGREVYEAIDGKRTIEQIVEAFATNHQLRFHEARLSVMQFLKMLTQRSLIVVALPEADDPAGEAAA